MSRESDKQVIFESLQKRFRQINEYVQLTGNNLDEAGDDQQDDAQGGMPPAGGDGMMPPAGGDGAPQGGMPGPGGADGGMMPPEGGDGAPQGPEGFNPQDGGADGMPPAGDDGMMPPPEGGEVGPDDDVVDVSELTDTEKETQHDVEKLDNKFGQIMKALGSFEELIKQNDEKINDLRSEFEKRNPTQIEKLSMQTAKSGPFNQSVEDFWKQKEATSNYSTEYDNNGKEQGQYVITADDVKGNVDWKSIADSLDDKDFIYNQTLKGVMNI